MRYGALTQFATDNNTGEVHLSVDTAFVLLEVRVSVDGGPELVIADDPVTTAPLTAGQSYTLTVQVLTPGGLCPPATIVMAAGAEPGGADITGFVLESGGYGYGAASDTQIVVALDPAPVGPVTPTPMYALVPYDAYAVPNHPSVTPDPGFSPTTPELVSWLYYKAPDGAETLRLVTTPPRQMFSQVLATRCWVGPDAGLYFFDIEDSPASVEGPYIDRRVLLYRSPAVEYGVEPPPPSVHIEYTVPNVRSEEGSMWVFWDADGTAVVTSTHRMFTNPDDEDVVATANVDRLVVAPAPPVAYNVNAIMHTAMGALWVSSGYVI